MRPRREGRGSHGFGRPSRGRPSRVHGWRRAVQEPGGASAPAPMDGGESQIKENARRAVPGLVCLWESGLRRALSTCVVYGASRGGRRMRARPLPNRRRTDSDGVRSRLRCAHSSRHPAGPGDRIRCCQPGRTWGPNVGGPVNGCVRKRETDDERGRGEGDRQRPSKSHTPTIHAILGAPVGEATWPCCGPAIRALAGVGRRVIGVATPSSPVFDSVLPWMYRREGVDTLPAHLEKLDHLKVSQLDVGVFRVDGQKGAPPVAWPFSRLGPTPPPRPISPSCGPWLRSASRPSGPSGTGTHQPRRPGSARTGFVKQIPRSTVRIPDRDPRCPDRPVAWLAGACRR